MSEFSSRSVPDKSVEHDVSPRDRCDRVVCPVCGGPGVEKKQKWFCTRCGQLLQTCCD